MKQKKGFTLTELFIALMIFSFMATSMVTIYSTITRHMFQNYRQDVWKISTALAMRTIQQNLLAATRIDLPAVGGWSNDLRFAVNIDQLTGCYPIKPGDPVTWHRFYLTGSQLFYCSGNIAGGTGCASTAPSLWAPNYACASAPVLLLDHVTTWTGMVTMPLFSRQSAQGVNEKGAVAVNLRIHWDPSILTVPGNLSASQHVIDYSLKTVVKINRPAL